jgi:hypothetical protein
MTLLQLRTDLMRLAGEDAASPVYYTVAACDSAINAAQQLFAFLSLCYEKTAPFTISPGWMAANVPDLIVPLRLQFSGARLIPTTIAELQSLSARWPEATGVAPMRYLWLGWDLVRLFPTPPTSAVVQLTYAAAPPALTADGSVPVIPEPAHHALLDYALPRLRLQEGGGELEKDLPRIERFLDAVSKQAAAARTRYTALGYDTRPAETHIQEEIARWRSTQPVS